MLPVRVHAPRWVTAAEVKALALLAHLKTLWSLWNLRSLILLSLGLQVVLILVAPFRKKTANTAVVITIWLAYLLADYVAIQAVGLIPNYSSRSAASYATHPFLLSFWAPFLLVHLGGTDPITALSLEDNELWLRTALHFFTYISATGRVFFQSLPTNLLSIPTILMFFAGFFKYLERVLSLYHARLTQFKSSLLTDQDSDPNNQQLKSYDVDDNQPEPDPHDYNFDDEDMSVIKTNIELNQNDDEGDDAEAGEEDDNNKVQGSTNLVTWLSCAFGRSHVILVWDAFMFFEKYKGLYVDLTFSLHDRDKSRAYFLQPTLTPEDAFTVLEIELNFTYEVFFTKMIVIHQTFGTRIRRVSFLLEVMSLLIWFLFIDKQPFHGFDIWITYTLLVGAVVIDSIAFLMVALSDWHVATLSKESKIRVFLYNKLLSARNRTWGGCWEAKESTLSQFLKRLFCRRWSESVFQFSLIDYCARPCSKSNLTNSLFKYVPPIKDKWQEFKYVSKKWFADDLRDFIFDELRYKAEMAQDPGDIDEIYSSKGDWVVRSLGGLDLDPFVFYKWTVDVEYDKCLLLWHVATEILYQMDDFDDSSCLLTGQERNYPKYCKTISDYMMYLLKWQPAIMFAVAGTSEVRFQDTSRDASTYFEMVLANAKRNDESKQERLKHACSKLMVNTDTGSRYIKADRSKSVLFDAVRLAKELRNMEKTKSTVGMWELMAKVWVELLCYSATHTRASAHAAQLRQGGELLTLVWLLSVHLGLSKQFHATQDDS